MTPKQRKFISIITISICIFLVSCNQTSHVKPYSRTTSFKNKYVDTSMIAIIPFKEFGKFVFDSTCKTASLNQNDLIEIEDLLDDCINNNNKNISKNATRGLEKKYRQYIAATNEKGEKIVWVNCFCETYNTDWKHSIVIVSDGGRCFYRLTINLTIKKYYNLMINGLA